MKTLHVLAIVALIGTTYADIPEYDKDIFDAMEFYDPNSGKISATIINAHVLKILVRGVDTDFNAVSFFNEPFFDEATENNDPFCGNLIGIELDGEIPFCNLDSMRVAFFKIRGRHVANSVRINLSFAVDTERPLILEVPVFKTPAQYASDPEQLETWAAEHELGILFPFNKEELQDILDDYNIISDFVWLDALLKYGVYQRMYPIRFGMAGEPLIPRESYVTRPIVIPEDIFTELKKTFSWNSEDGDLVNSLLPSPIEAR